MIIECDDMIEVNGLYKQKCDIWGGKKIMWTHNKLGSVKNKQTQVIKYKQMFLIIIF